MDLLETLKNKLVKKTPMTDFCLQTIRLRKMIKTVYQILMLFEDGQEKIQGEYIFDSHYTSSLAESILEKTGDLVFDANIIAEEGGADLYRVYDQYQEWVQTTLFNLSESVAKRESLADAFEQEPEFQTLKLILGWLDHKNPDQLETVRGFIKLVFEHVLLNGPDIPGTFSNTIQTEFTDGNATHKVLSVGLYEGDRPVKESAGQSWECEPLSHLLSEFQSIDRPKTENGASYDASWLAATERDQLSLILLEGSTRPVHIEAFQENDTGLKMIFAFFDEKFSPELSFDTTFFKEQIGTGQMICLIDSNLNLFRSDLKKLGQSCLSIF